MRTPLRIALCGGLTVELDGQSIETRLAGRQGREVFAYLVLNRFRQVSRDEVTALLWPERAPRSPEAAFNTILARLRRVLGPAALGSRGRLMLELPAGSWIDVEAVQAAATEAETLLAIPDPVAAQATVASALGLLAAPLLPELAHTWVQQWRSDLDDLGARLLIVGIRAGLALGGVHLQDGERHAQALIEREPFRESGYAMLMEVQTARGDVAEALRVYEQLRTLLRDELGVPPSPQLAAQHRMLLREHPAPPARPAVDGGPDRSATRVALPPALARDGAVVIAGREAERATLRAPWSEPVSGPPSLTVIAGEPGIGKSTLVASLAREVHEQGTTALYGRAEEDPIVPYVAVVQALRHYLTEAPAALDDEQLHRHVAELHWLIPELHLPEGTPQPSDRDLRVDRLRFYRAAAAVLMHAAARTDVLLVLEDLQWADSDTVMVVRQLLRERTDHPVRTVFTYRDGEIDADHPLARMLAEIRRDVSMTRITLTGLDETAIGQMLSQHHPERGGEDGRAELVRRLHAHTSGNPFFIEEVVRSLDEQGTGVEDPGRAAGNVGLLPEGVLAVIQERLRRMPDVTREALDAAAVLGDAFGLDLLAAVLGYAWGATAIDAAVRSGLVVGDERTRGRYRFCHALARQAIYQSIGPGRRSELHLAAARALEQRREQLSVEAAEIAHHLAESNRAEATMEAVVYLREAAERSLAHHAYEAASAHLRGALDLLARDRPHDTATRCELLLALGEVSWRAGNPRARAVYEQALTVARGLGGHEQLAEAALGLGGRFYAPDAPDAPYIQLLEQTLESIEEHNRPLRTRTLGRLAEHLMLFDPDRAAALSATALDTARVLDDDELLAASLLSRHASLLAVHGHDERRRLAAEQVELAHGCGDRELEALGIHWLLYDLLEAGDTGAVPVALARLRELSGELRQPLYRHSTLVWTRVVNQLEGRLERADQLSHEALNLSAATQGGRAKIHFVCQRMSVVRDAGGAQQLLATSRRWPSEGSLLWLSARWLLELECGELTTDQERDRAVSGIGALPRNMFWLPTVGWLAEVISHAGDARQAAVLHALLTPHADRWIQLVFDGTFGCVRRPLGLLAARMNRPEEAAGHLRQAAARHRAAGAPALEARTLYDHGQAIADGRVAGTRAESMALLERARDLSAARGASRLAERVNDALAHTGPTPARR